MTTKYQKLKQEFLHDISSKASEKIPKMYKALRDEGLSPQEARQKLEEDLLEHISERTLLRYLPLEAKDKEQSERRSHQNKTSVDNVSTEQETTQSDGMVLLGRGPNFNDSGLQRIMKDYEKTRDENKELQEALDNLQIKWKSICHKHREEIQKCEDCGGEHD